MKYDYSRLPYDSHNKDTILIDINISPKFYTEVCCDILIGIIYSKIYHKKVKNYKLP